MLQEYLQYLITEKRSSSNTVISYKNDLESFYQYLQLVNKSLSFDQVEYKDLRGWIVYLHEQNNSNRSINRKISAIRSFYKYAMTMGVLKVNPAQRITLLKTEKKLPEFVSEESMDLLLDDFEKNDHLEYNFIISRTVFELFYSTGMRIDELVNVKDEDINSYQNTIKIRGKGNKIRILPISNRLKIILTNFQNTRNEQVIKVENTDYLFLTKKGKKMYKKFVYNLISYYLSGVTTIKKKSPHTMRHTFATHMLNRGADINIIKEILGHSSLAATQIYIHNSIEQLKNVYNQAHPKA